MCTNSQIEDEFNYKDAHDYNSPELDYYKPDAFNQPDNSPDAYHVEDPKKYKCWHHRRHFFWITSYILIFEEIVIDNWIMLYQKRSMTWLIDSAVSQIYQQISKV